MSNSDSEEETELNIWSWTPAYNPNAPTLFRTKSNAPLNFLVYDDLISKQRLEKIIVCYGGSVCCDNVETYSIILLNENVQPPEDWGQCYSRKYIRDCIENFELLELNHYLIPKCVATQCEGSLTSALLEERFEFRPAPIPISYYSKEMGTNLTIIKNPHVDKVIENQAENNPIQNPQDDKLIENHNNDMLIENHNNDMLIENHNNGMLIENHNNDMLIENQNSDMLIENQNSDMLVENQNSDMQIENQNSDMQIENHNNDHPMENPSNNGPVENSNNDCQIENSDDNIRVPLNFNENILDSEPPSDVSDYKIANQPQKLTIKYKDRSQTIYGHFSKCFTQFLVVEHENNTSPIQMTHPCEGVSSNEVERGMALVKKRKLKRPLTSPIDLINLEEPQAHSSPLCSSRHNKEKGIRPFLTHTDAINQEEPQAHSSRQCTSGHETGKVKSPHLTHTDLIHQEEFQAHSSSQGNSGKEIEKVKRPLLSLTDVINQEEPQAHSSRQCTSGHEKEKLKRPLLTHTDVLNLDESQSDSSPQRTSRHEQVDERSLRVSRLPQTSDSEENSDEGVPDLKNWPNLKKNIIPNKHTRMKYSYKEKSDIIKYIVAKRAYGRLRSDALYREIEARNICPQRTYQSMKNHFLKTLINELDRFDFLSDNAKRKLRGEFW